MTWCLPPRELVALRTSLPSTTGRTTSIPAGDGVSEPSSSSEWLDCAVCGSWVWVYATRSGAPEGGDEMRSVKFELYQCSKDPVTIQYFTMNMHCVFFSFLSVYKIRRPGDEANTFFAIVLCSVLEYVTLSSGITLLMFLIFFLFILLLSLKLQSFGKQQKSFTSAISWCTGKACFFF